MFKPKPHRALKNQSSSTSVSDLTPFNATSHLFRICVLGARSCGKTCLIERFVDGLYNTETEPTIEDTYEVITKMGNEMVTTHILDTAGEELSSGMYSSYIKKADGFVVCYKVQDHQSFTVACKMMAEIRRLRYEDVPLILVGNDFSGSDNPTVVVTKQEVNDQCNLHQIQQRYSISAENHTNVSAPFVLIAQLLLKNPPPKKRKDKIPGEE
ncbi:hypothetical protein SARC_04973 [Sphaeroforma arctica JP610]|uniref:Uncharacterized protein n=1 Tax=Sphaeroforma arctica JP610 TaxID=667725 RepID=A0A0L0G1N7_9EUKA|nr:hypothetical protein SARC_04973 [Sphaeroforma arctica JP610]KNC82731.1 hypothetical protein SARC_04973 [Sphaeroforma arctica JP610]|eukprot:XP_014156633.1 hypothetical protein SARC_04973 [Sphaeroforma arctica JP610]